MAVPLPPRGFQATHVTSLGRLCRKQVAFEIEFWIFRTYLSTLGYPESMEFLWLIGAHFHWKLSSKKTLLHKPDSYGQQSSLRVNTSYTEDHESSAIDAGLLLWPITGKRSNEPWNWFVKTSIQRGSLTRSWKLLPQFFQTQLTAPGSARMVSIRIF